MAAKIAASGLRYQHLKLSLERNGYDGIEALFKESIDGLQRVTRCKKNRFSCFSVFFKLSKGRLLVKLQMYCSNFFFLISPSNFFWNAQSLLHMYLLLLC